MSKSPVRSRPNDTSQTTEWQRSEAKMSYKANPDRSTAAVDTSSASMAEKHQNRRAEKSVDFKLDNQAQESGKASDQEKSAKSDDLAELKACVDGQASASKAEEAAPNASSVAPTAVGESLEDELTVDGLGQFYDRISVTSFLDKSSFRQQRSAAMSDSYHRSVYYSGPQPAKSILRNKTDLSSGRNASRVSSYGADYYPRPRTERYLQHYTEGRPSRHGYHADNNYHYQMRGR